MVFFNWISGDNHSDPTKILTENYTTDQTRAQNLLDLNSNASIQPQGELLVIIPFKNLWDLTRDCLVTLNSQKMPSAVKIRTILIDNRSDDQETIRLSEMATKDYPYLNISNLKADYEFNYSRLNNEAFRKFASADTRWVLFLNNDIQLCDPSIISKMLSMLETTAELGVVGCTLLYPSGHIQHLFAAPGTKIVAAHPLKDTKYDQKLHWFEKTARPVAAVTGAVMMLRASDFNAVGMFDENLPTLGQDIILCLAIENRLKKFSATVSTNAVFHHESKTKKTRFPEGEIVYLYKNYGQWLSSRKWLSSKFSRWSERPLKKIFPEGEYPAESIIKYWI